MNFNVVYLFKLSCNTQAVKSVDEEVTKIVYAFPKHDFLTFTTCKGRTGHAILKEAKKTTDKAGVTRADFVTITHKVAVDGLRLLFFFSEPDNPKKNK